MPIKIKTDIEFHLNRIPDKLLDKVDNSNIVQCTILPKYVDFAILCDKHIFLVDSELVKNQIEYFRVCLSDKWITLKDPEYESKDDEYKVYEMKLTELFEDCSPESFGHILFWIHRGTFDHNIVAIDDCFSMFKICEMFDLKECLRKVGQLLVLKLEVWLRTAFRFCPWIEEPGVEDSNVYGADEFYEYLFYPRKNQTELKEQIGYEVHGKDIINNHNRLMYYYNFAKNYQHVIKDEEQLKTYGINDIIFLLRKAMPSIFLPHSKYYLGIKTWEITIDKSKKTIRIDPDMTKFESVQKFPVELIQALGIVIQEHMEANPNTFFRNGHSYIGNPERSGSTMYSVNCVFEGDEVPLGIPTNAREIHKDSRRTVHIEDKEDDSKYIGALFQCSVLELDAISKFDNFIQEMGIEIFFKQSTIIYIYKIYFKCKWYKEHMSSSLKSEYLMYKENYVEFMSSPNREFHESEQQDCSLFLWESLAKKFDDKFAEMKNSGNEDLQKWAEMCLSIKQKEKQLILDLLEY